MRLETKHDKRWKNEENGWMRSQKQSEHERDNWWLRKYNGVRVNYISIFRPEVMVDSDLQAIPTKNGQMKNFCPMPGFALLCIKSQWANQYTEGRYRKKRINQHFPSSIEYMYKWVIYSSYSSICRHFQSFYENTSIMKQNFKSRTKQLIVVLSWKASLSADVVLLKTCPLNRKA